MIRTYKYKLLPRKEESRKFDYMLDLTRNIYNTALEQRISAYKDNDEILSYAEQCAYFRDLRNADPDGLGILSATCVQQTLRKLDKAYKAFFRRVKRREESVGFPRFKSYKRWKSFEFPHGNGCKFIERNGKAILRVLNVGNVKVKYHRAIPEDANIKHVVVKKHNKKWYVCLQIELPDIEYEREDSDRCVGIDIGLKSLLALSTGELIDNPHWFRESERKLRVAQRRASRRDKGSAGRQEALGIVANIHEQIANQRKDFWHKTTRDLINKYEVIAIEDFSLGFMLQNEHVSKSAYDAGLGMFREMIAYKAEGAGKSLILVNAKNTSQECSGCGRIVEKTIDERVHKCPHCGLVLDRDVNAAVNVLARTGRLGANVSQETVRGPRTLATQ